MYWALDPDTGKVIWATMVGPGGTLGGIEYGAATDGGQIYTGIGNSTHADTVLKKGKIVNGGFWSALDASTGQIRWQTPAQGTQSNGQLALANGSVSVANGIMYGEDHAGFFVALDAGDGLGAVEVPERRLIDRRPCGLRWLAVLGVGLFADRH